jgi:hypothetical protein
MPPSIEQGKSAETIKWQSTDDNSMRAVEAMIGAELVIN